MDSLQPERWHDFFIATAGAAAALTGLLFVALSLHIERIASDTIYRNMARGSLIGLVQTLVLSLVVLVRQPASWTGIELMVVSVGYIVANASYQVISFQRMQWRVPRVTLVRGSLGHLLAIAGLVGGLNLLLQFGPGLYVIAFIAITVILWNLWNAWVLLMGVADEELGRTAPR